MQTKFAVNIKGLSNVDLELVTGVQAYNFRGEFNHGCELPYCLAMVYKTGRRRKNGRSWVARQFIVTK